MQSTLIEFRADPAFHIGLRIPLVFMAEFVQSLGDFVDVFFTDRSCSAINAAEFAPITLDLPLLNFFAQAVQSGFPEIDVPAQYVDGFWRSVGMHIQHKASIAARGAKSYPFCIYQADTIIGTQFSKTVSCRHTTDAAANDRGLYANVTRWFWRCKGFRGLCSPPPIAIRVFRYDLCRWHASIAPCVIDNR